VTPVPLARAVGRAELTVALQGGGTRLVHLHEAGPSRLRFPTPADPAVLEALLLNNAGGLAGGDRIEQVVRVGEGAAATVATASAEKVYRARDDEPARVTTRLEVAAGARLAWLPQEAILFDRARLVRTLDVELAADARLLLLEAVVLGRTAMGETVEDGLLEDRLVLRVDGRLVRLDALRLDGPIEMLRRRPALLGGALALATILRIGPEPEGWVEDRRARAAALPGRIGIGARAGVAVARLLAPDGRTLRGQIAGLIDGLPRVWGG
jgi:urease accessory protein